jgi:phosphatidylglycerophosphate synthase
MPSSKPSVAELRALGQPPELLARRNAEHWAGRLYMRRVSPYVTWALLRTGLSANAVTFLMALVGFAGAYSFKYGTMFGAIVGAVGIQLYLLLDCSDGEMARVKGTTGPTGIFLDRLGHFVVEATLLVAVGVAAAEATACDGEVCFVFRPDRNWYVLGFVTALIHVLGKLQTDLVEVARAKAGLPPVTDDAETAAPTSGSLRSIRRAAALFPLFRILQAVEASILVLLATIADHFRGDVQAMRGLVIVFLVAAIYEFVGHLVGILSSSRLRS